MLVYGCAQDEFDDGAPLDAETSVERHVQESHGQYEHGYADGGGHPDPRVQWVEEGQWLRRKLQWHDDGVVVHVNGRGEVCKPRTAGVLKERPCRRVNTKTMTTELKSLQAIMLQCPDILIHENKIIVPLLDELMIQSKLN